MAHLVVDISAHGFGHLAQTAAVLNALELPDLTLTLRSLAPEAILCQRIHQPFQLIRYQQDNGMVMHNALQVDSEASFVWHQHFHQQYAAHLAQAKQDLAKLKPDLVLANVPYLSLQAAFELGIPTLALCSLNWAEVFKAYCGDRSGAEIIYQQMLSAYQSAQYFLQPTPSMPMPALTNAQAIATLAPKGQRQTPQLLKQLGLNSATQVILVSLGGIGMEYPLAQWPKLDGVYWIFPDEVLAHYAHLAAQRSDLVPQSRAQLTYVDLLASCHVVLTKTGYGTQTEVVVNQVPSLCVLRHDWPEEPVLKAWHAEHGEVEFIDWSFISTPEVIPVVQNLLKRSWRKPAVQANGACQAASYIKALLR